MIVKHTDNVTQTLIICGILSSVWYVVINIYVPTQYEGYHISSFTVSELSAIGASTRKLWLALVFPYPILFGAFGIGVLRSARENRALRIIGRLAIAYSVFNIYWPPMHQRGVEPTLTDSLHIVWAAVTVVLMVVMMGTGVRSLGKVFGIFTGACLLLLTLFGVLTGLESPNIPINGPTPWIGVWERINIGIFMLWIIMLSTALLRRNEKQVDV